MAVRVLTTTCYFNVSESNYRAIIEPALILRNLTILYKFQIIYER